MEVAKVTSKGQITIPISIRRKLELDEGDKVLFIYKPEGVLMVNPNTMQGGVSGDITEFAETETASEAIAAMKQREESKTPQTAAIEIQKPPATTPVASTSVASTPVASTPSTPDTVATTPQPEHEISAEPTPQQSRPVPPPGEELEPPQDKHLGGFNLSTLLDDIRSIGSNI